MKELYVVGAIFACLGFINVFFPFKKIGLWGYRSQKSIENTENWSLAQKASGRCMLSSGCFLSVLGLCMPHLSFDQLIQNVLAITACIISVLNTIIYTELSMENDDSIQNII